MLAQTVAPGGRTALVTSGNIASGVLEGVITGLASDWRLDEPASGTVVVPGVTLFHDAAGGNFVVQRRERDLAFTIYQFPGTYMSVAVDVPAPFRARLRPGWRFTVGLAAEASRSTTTFVRLNLSDRHNKKVLHEVVVVDTGERGAVFDLDGVGSDWSSAWVDLIFSHPRMSEIRVSGLRLGFEEQ